MKLWQYINRLPQLFAEVKELKIVSDQTVQEISDIKTSFTTYQTAVNAKIAALEAQISAGGGISPAIQAALDDLKQTVSSAQVPA